VLNEKWATLFLPTPGRYSSSSEVIFFSFRPFFCVYHVYEAMLSLLGYFYAHEEEEEEEDYFLLEEEEDDDGEHISFSICPITMMTF
jgi:hypothetical protein